MLCPTKPDKTLNFEFHRSLEYTVFYFRIAKSFALKIFESTIRTFSSGFEQHIARKSLLSLQKSLNVPKTLKNQKIS